MLILEELKEELFVSAFLKIKAMKKALKKKINLWCGRKEFKYNVKRSM